MALKLTISHFKGDKFEKPKEVFCSIRTSVDENNNVFVSVSQLDKVGGKQLTENYAGFKSFKFENPELDVQKGKLKVAEALNEFATQKVKEAAEALGHIVEIV